ncbi:MAG TPA: thioredoxin domain-containing protein, partial [Planctomycetota bacterium]|nr:thioredoxin domain-containing protein [Planctomycetota bacterium]
DETVRSMLAVVRGKFLPQRVVALASASSDVGLMPLLEGRTAPANGARAFVCRNYACSTPATTKEELARQLD